MRASSCCSSRGATRGDGRDRFFSTGANGRRVRRLGLALLIGGLAASALLFMVEPLPEGTFALARDGEGRGVVRAAKLLHYDAANDTTLAVFGDCGHVPCGDAFAFPGDVRARFQEGKPWLVEPNEGFARVRADVSLGDRTGTPPPYGDPAKAAGAFVAGPAELRGAWPPVVLHALALTTAAVGAALALGARWAAAGPALGGAATLLTWQGGGFLLIIVSVSIGVPTALLAGGLASRPKTRRLALLLAPGLATFLLVGWVTGHFAPERGSEL